MIRARLSLSAALLAVTAALGLLSVSGPSLAQRAGYDVVATCGTATGRLAGNPAPPTEDVNGNACSSASLSGSVTATTAVTASSTPTAVAAGANRAMNEGLFSNLFVTPVSPTGAQVDLSAPASIMGVDGLTIATAANPFPTHDSVVGAIADSACSTDTGVACTVEAMLKRIAQNLTALQATTASSGGSTSTINITYTGGKSPTNTVLAFNTDASGNLIAVGAGTAGTPAGGVASIQGVSGGTPVPVSHASSATGGATPSHAIVANNTTSVAIDASPGTLYAVQVFNNSATIAYLKFYDAAQGSTTCGSGTPKKVVLIPANTSGAGAVIAFPTGVAFATAISRCVTTGIADNDTGAPAASTYLIEADYK